MKEKFFVFAVFIYAAFLVAEGRAVAATFPLSNVDVFAKSIESGQVVSGHTDDNGNFNVTVKEENGAYNIFIGDENTTPVKISAQKNIVSARIVILTESTITKDPDPTPAPATVPVSVSVPKAKVKKPAPVVAPTATKKAKAPAKKTKTEII